jgi:hypothetical protein
LPRWDPTVWALLGYTAIDADGDGFTVPASGQLCTDGVLPPPFRATGNGNDCDDAEPALTHFAVLYPDGDGDGVGAPPRQVLCLGASTPDGVVPGGYDEDDTDPSVIETEDFDDLLELIPLGDWRHRTRSKTSTCVRYAASIRQYVNALFVASSGRIKNCRCVQRPGAAPGHQIEPTEEHLPRQRHARSSVTRSLPTTHNTISRRSLPPCTEQWAAERFNHPLAPRLVVPSACVPITEHISGDVHCGRMRWVAAAIWM